MLRKDVLEMKQRLFIAIFLMLLLFTGCQSEFYHQDDMIDCDVKEKTDQMIENIIANIIDENYDDIPISAGNTFGEQTKEDIMITLEYISNL